VISISAIQEAVKRIAPEYPIKSVVLFGSYAERTADSAGDVDVLVEFRAPAVSLLMLSSLKNRLENELNTSVNLIHGPLNANSMITLGKVVPVYER